MDIKFLGTGGAFDFQKGNAAAIVTLNEKNILIDCGSTTCSALEKHGLLEKIDYILVTHMHADHVGSLATLLAYYKYKTSKLVPQILLFKETFGEEITNLLTCSLESDLAQYKPLTSFPGIGCIDTTGQHKEGMTSFAYHFSKDNKMIYYSGDIGNADTAKSFLDTRSESEILVFHETTPNLNMESHTSYKELQETLADYDVYAYHIAKENMPKDCTLQLVENYPKFLY